MEHAIGFGAKVTGTAVSRVADEVVDTLWRQICYVWNYKTNIQELNQQLNNLKDKMKSLQHQKEEAERKGRGIEDEVTNWLERAGGAVEVAEKLIEDHKSANKNCCMGCCPNLKTRYRFSRAATKHTPVFAQVQGERTSITTISYVLDVQNLQAPKNYEALDTRTDVLNKVLSALKNVDFNLIGVYGAPGVGKSTLARQHLFDEVKRVGAFEVVTCAEVTQAADLKSIQEELAAWLGLTFEVESTQVRAVRLCDRLKKEEKVLVILDDIWKRIKLEEIGIPNDKDSKGCKVFMTSRNQDVLSAMGVQEQFVLKDLEEDEAWQLFQAKLGDTLDSDLQPIAFEVSKRCAGLPGLITAVATSLRNQDLCVWKDSLEGLKQFDHKEIDDQVNSALKLSYDFLQTDAKLVFLLCGQNGAHNIDIKYLLKYGLGLGIFKSCKTVQAARNKLHSLLNALKASCLLLESGNKDGLLQMHDLVHHFAITTASEDQPVITSNGMSDLLEDDTLEKCEAMVLKDGKIPHFFGVLNCHKLRFFLLNVDLSLEIGDNFFEGMKGLRVLNLTKAYFSSLPFSLQFLKDLQTLCLDSCVLEDVTLIGELKKLQVLSLVNCTITCLPGEIGNLSNLKLLDLKDCSSLEVIEPNVFSRLTRLEELHMENSFVKWEDIEASNGKRVNANLSELEHLSKLVSVRMHIVDSKMLPKDLELVIFFENFKILIGEEWDWNVEHKTSRTLKLKLNTIDHLERVKGFLMRTEDLYLGLLKGVEGVLDNLDGEGFPHLKHLLLQNSQDIRYIIGGRWMDHVTAFPKLESLVLNNLNQLETISTSPLNMRSFGSLRRIKVGSCNLLRNLFSFSMLKGLEKLEEFDVCNCKIIESIAADGADDDGVDDTIKLEHLQTITLDHLPQFASFSAQIQSTKKPTIASGEIISADELENPSGLFNDKVL
ncbi:Disease resistance protein (CC-NBS-LRR class) family [Euphorbia peplus]|nr:Disease resistance protein (CC-NBS-LRR class) family [Euphorbia peplus]